MSASALVITVTALIGQSLAANPSLATLPLSLQFATMMLVTLPASLFMKRVGRRGGFITGAGIGVAAGLLGAYALWRFDFALYCLASVLFGTASTFVQYYRFAAIEVADERFKNRAISLVMAGGVVSAFVGTEIAKWTGDLFPPHAFLGTYLGLAGLFALLLLIVATISFPPAQGQQDGAAGGPRPRRAGELMRQPVFAVAVLCAAVAYGSMNLIMAATPLSMLACGFGFTTAASVIQWHIVGMYAPSFVTGHLIDRIGAQRVIAVGATLILICVVVHSSSIALTAFWLGLLVLGIGWNFMFVGATTLLTEGYRPEEKAKAQGLNDLLVFATISGTALASGSGFAAFGWALLNQMVVLPLLICLAAALWISRHRPVPPDAASA